jgi:Fe-S cluster assembly iron-binding protein IscA
MQIHLMGVDLPDEDDYVIEDEGARIFVEADLAPRLEDKILDAEMTQDGPAFTVIAQD